MSETIYVVELTIEQWMCSEPDVFPYRKVGPAFRSKSEAHAYCLKILKSFDEPVEPWRVEEPTHWNENLETYVAVNRRGAETYKEAHCYIHEVELL